MGINISTGTSGATVTDAGTALEDVTDGQTAAPGLTAFTAAATTDTISETNVTAGANLSLTDLSDGTDAQTALTALNSAISDVASQRGYLGSQINTLNSISGVETTEEENLTSAETSISATNYGQATTAMSSEEVLSQTGISALAQANSSQQEFSSCCNSPRCNPAFLGGWRTSPAAFPLEFSFLLPIYHTRKGTLRMGAVGLKFRRSDQRHRI